VRGLCCDCPLGRTAVSCLCVAYAGAGFSELVQVGAKEPGFPREPRTYEMEGVGGGGRPSAS
jgi:hypothetical protein